MTDRISGYVVALDHDVREDDVEPILNAIRMIKGVCVVEPVGSSVEIQIATTRAKLDLQQKLIDVLR